MTRIARNVGSKDPAPDLLADQAHDALLAHLRSGRLRSGAFLSMPVLVDDLGLPIAAVREAVKRAEAAELLSVLPKRGVMVMEATPQTTRECLELRAIFDGEGARWLIAAGHGIDLPLLRARHEALRDRARTQLTPDLPPDAIVTDLSLHDALSRGLQSRLAQRLYAQNRDRIAVIQNSRPFLADRIVSAMAEHLEIIAALEARDSARCLAAIRDHLAQTLRWWGIAPGA